MSLVSLLTGGSRIPGAEARALVEKGAVLVDVRTPAEFEGAHVPGAINIPVHALQGRLGELSPEEPVVLYCRSGARSGSAAKMLRSAGFEQVFDVGPMGAYGGPGVSGARPLTELLVPLLVSLTLGLAPITPEPHLVGKLRWVAGGAVGMGSGDWFDLAMHGAPWVWLIVVAFQVAISRVPRPGPAGTS